MYDVIAQILKEIEKIKTEEVQMQLQVTFNKNITIKYLSRKRNKFKYDDLQGIYEYFMHEEIPQNLFTAAVFYARHLKSYHRVNEEFISDFHLLKKEVEQIKYTFFKSELLEKCKFEIGISFGNMEKIIMKQNIVDDDLDFYYLEYLFLEEEDEKE